MQLLLKANYNASLLLPPVYLLRSTNACICRLYQLISLSSLIVSLAAKLSCLVLAFTGSGLASYCIVVVIIVGGEMLFFSISLYNLYVDDSVFTQRINSDTPVINYFLVHSHLLAKVIHLVPRLIYGHLLAKLIYLIPCLAQLTAHLFH